MMTHGRTTPPIDPFPCRWDDLWTTSPMTTWTDDQLRTTTTFGYNFLFFSFIFRPNSFFLSHSFSFLGQNLSYFHSDRHGRMLFNPRLSIRALSLFPIFILRITDNGPDPIQIRVPWDRHILFWVLTFYFFFSSTLFSQSTILCIVLGTGIHINFSIRTSTYSNKF